MLLVEVAEGVSQGVLETLTIRTYTLHQVIQVIAELRYQLWRSEEYTLRSSRCQSPCPEPLPRSRLVCYTHLPSQAHLSASPLLHLLGSTLLHDHCVAHFDLYSCLPAYSFDHTIRHHYSSSTVVDPYFYRVTLMFDHFDNSRPISIHSHIPLVNRQ